MFNQKDIIIVISQFYNIKYPQLIDAQPKTAPPWLAVLPHQHTSSTAYLKQYPSIQIARSYDTNLLKQ
ncbi:hypothetical protein FGO68_gene10075 [Halteria grandinella]|uniref:Uncharacterized protein n=1 Tax=Halteria grandinella TaxID=5974 RepID=A0A8J8T5F5_HALGN|nr:hypothetical protein FGO68_gene10075 [Halteria grandinella]